MLRTASGERTKSEQLGYGDLEFVPWNIGATMQCGRGPPPFKRRGSRAPAFPELGGNVLFEPAGSLTDLPGVARPISTVVTAWRSRYWIAPQQAPRRSAHGSRQKSPSDEGTKSEQSGYRDLEFVPWKIGATM